MIKRYLKNFLEEWLPVAVSLGIIFDIVLIGLLLILLSPEKYIPVIHISTLSPVLAADYEVHGASCWLRSGRYHCVGQIEIDQ